MEELIDCAALDRKGIGVFLVLCPPVNNSVVPPELLSEASVEEF